MILLYQLKLQKGILFPASRWTPYFFHMKSWATKCERCLSGTFKTFVTQFLIDSAFSPHNISCHIQNTHLCPIISHWQLNRHTKGLFILFFSYMRITSLLDDPSVLHQITFIGKIFMKSSIQATSAWVENVMKAKLTFNIRFSVFSRKPRSFMTNFLSERNSFSWKARLNEIT